MTPRPRVLQVVQRFFPEIGGTETHVAEVAGRISRAGELDVTVLTTDRSGQLERTQTVDGLPVIRRRSYPRTKDLYLSPGIAPVIARGGWDLVHFQGVHTLVPPVGMLSALAGRVPYVLTFHSGGHSDPRRTAVRGTQWKVLAPLLRRADRLVAVSRFERSHFSAAAGIDPDRFVVIPNGGVLPATPADLLPVPGRIVTSGRLEHYKGHHRAIEALPLVRAQVPDAHLLVLGSGDYEPVLRSLAADLGVEHAVEIRSLPPADRSGMARELAQSSVMAALSSYEAHPVGIMEAVTLGLPVVGFDIAGTGDLVEDGLVTGVDPDASTEQVAAALVTALRGTAERGPVPHQPVHLDLPTWDTSAAALTQVYRDVLAGRRRRG
jgi:glycosyltransferase involved in cell wall biosynthesis